jgi:hypothetical protein
MTNAHTSMETLEPRVLLSADPISPDHELWTVPTGESVVDGVLDDAAWEEAFRVVRTQAWRDDGTVTILMMHSAEGMYLGLEANDENLWADGLGSGTGDRWEVETDDSVTFYFDSDNSRDEYFGASDRAFGVNLGNPDDSVNGSGTVRRWKYVQGTGDGDAPDVIPGGNPDPGIEWATVVSGTVNNAGDTDTGWVTEIFLPWDALNMTSPTHGQTIGMNFDVIFDNDGGDRSFTDNRDGVNRFDLPAFVDDHVQGAHSAYHASQAGIRGPVNYAEVMFVDAETDAKPATVLDLTVSGEDAFGARLGFTAPAGTTSGDGHVSAYEIRYSTSAISTGVAWNSATVFENAYVPRLSGLSETLRLVGLEPSTTYHVAVRATDANGTLGNLAGSVSFTTTALPEPGYTGRIVPSPGGSTLMFENGDPFVPVGEHLGMSWAYFRNLYPGDVWDPAGQTYQNYHEEPSWEGEVGPHLDVLEAAGVNTLRVFLEILNLDQTGNPSTPDGRYWIEYPAGVYNPQMKQFVLSLLEEAAARDIRLIFTPFDTFTWDDVFAEETPWYSGNGGPLGDIDDFYQNSQTITMAKQRLRTVMDWVGESPHAGSLLGWEPMNEWDSYEWTLNSEGDADPGRETEMRRRAQWISELNAYVRKEDPDRLIFSSTTARDPRGPLARALFNDRSVDVLAPHFYTNSSEEPVNNPDSEKMVMPAVENALLGNYWLTHTVAARPILNGEWGMTRADWPGEVPSYGGSFTQADDEDLYRAVSWSGLASGQAGPGLRIAADELSSNLYSLTDAMRDVQLTISRFAADESIPFDFATFTPGTLVGSIDASSAAGKSLLAWGVADGGQGIAYVMQDRNVTTGWVTDGVLTLDGLDHGLVVSAQVWRTAGASAAPQATEENLLVFGGGLSLDLAGFNEDIAVRFAATDTASAITLDTGGDGTGTGTVTGASGVDLLSFVAAGPGEAIVSLDGYTGTLEVYDSTGTLLATGSQASDASISVGEGSAYYVVVRSGGLSGSFTIGIDGPGADADDHADAQQYDLATALTVQTNGNVSISGDVEGPGDTDLFSFDAGGTGGAQFSVSGSGAQLSVYDTDGLLLGSGTSYQMDVIHTVTYHVLVELADGDATGSYSLSVNGPSETDPFAAGVGGFVLPSAQVDGEVTITTLNGDGDVLAMLDANDHTSWSGLAVTSEYAGPDASGMSDTWVDPKDDLTYVASPSAEGLIVYQRAGDGSWSWTNLTTALGGGASAIVAGLTHFVSPDLSRGFDGQLILNDAGNPIFDLPERDRNNVSVAGLNADGDLVLYTQRRDEDYGATYWTYRNITQQDLIPTGQTPPVWEGDLIGYATPWNGQNIAGLDAEGQIIAVWTAPDRNGVWAATNLSASYGTPQLAGGLSVYVNWGINLTGVRPDGSLGVTWWSAQLESERRSADRTDLWAFSDLTADAEGPALKPETVTNYTTPNWASNNIVGVTEFDEVVVYWWTPENGGNYGREWLVQNLTDLLPDADIPVGRMSAIAPRDDTYSLHGVSETGDVLRYFWSAPTGWTFQNVTDTAQALAA